MAAPATQCSRVILPANTDTGGGHAADTAGGLGGWDTAWGDAADTKGGHTDNTGGVSGADWWCLKLRCSTASTNSKLITNSKRVGAERVEPGPCVACSVSVAEHAVAVAWHVAH